MDLPEGNVSQVNQVRLMLRWHQKQLETIHKLQTDKVTNTYEYVRATAGHWFELFLRYSKVTRHLTLHTSFALHTTVLILFYDKKKKIDVTVTCTPLREATPMYRKTPYSTGMGIN